MKSNLVLLVIIFLCACKNEEEPIVIADIDKGVGIIISDSLILNNDVEKETYPAAYCLDSSWRVFSDIQEGFFMSYTINYTSKKDTTVNIDSISPAIGGVDHPEPYYQDSLTYVVPNAGGCNRGYYTLYIYKDGSYQFVEQISVINSLKKEISESGDKQIDSTFNSYWESIYHTVFNSSNQVYLAKNTRSIKFSNAYSFYIDSKIDSFQVEGRELDKLKFVYSEYTGLYWREGKQPEKGSIKGILLSDKTWLLTIDVFIELQNKINNEKLIRNLKISSKFIKK